MDGTELHRQTVMQVLSNLVSQGLIKETRKVGKSQMYKINLTDFRVVKLVDLYNSILKKQELNIEHDNNEDKECKEETETISVCT